MEESVDDLRRNVRKAESSLKEAQNQFKVEDDARTATMKRTAKDVKDAEAKVVSTKAASDEYEKSVLSPAVDKIKVKLAYMRMFALKLPQQANAISMFFATPADFTKYVNNKLFNDNSSDILFFNDSDTVKNWAKDREAQFPAFILINKPSVLEDGGRFTAEHAKQVAGTSLGYQVPGSLPAEPVVILASGKQKQGGAIEARNLDKFPFDFASDTPESFKGLDLVTMTPATEAKNQLVKLEKFTEQIELLMDAGSTIENPDPDFDRLATERLSHEPFHSLDVAWGKTDDIITNAVRVSTKGFKGSRVEFTTFKLTHVTRVIRFARSEAVFFHDAVQGTCASEKFSQAYRAALSMDEWSKQFQLEARLCENVVAALQEGKSAIGGTNYPSRYDYALKVLAEGYTRQSREEDPDNFKWLDFYNRSSRAQLEYEAQAARDLEALGDEEREAMERRIASVKALRKKGGPVRGSELYETALATSLEVQKYKYKQNTTLQLVELVKKFHANRGALLANLKEYPTRPYSSPPVDGATSDPKLAYPHNINWQATFIKDVFYRYGCERSLSMAEADPCSLIGSEEMKCRQKHARKRDNSSSDPNAINTKDFLRFVRDFKICPQMISVKAVEECVQKACCGAAAAEDKAVLTYPEFVEAVVFVGLGISWTKVLDVLKTIKIACDWRDVERTGKILGEVQRMQALEALFPPPFNEDFLNPLILDNEKLTEEEQELKPRTRFLFSVIEQENERRIEAPRGALESTRILVKLFIYFGSTIFAVPITRTLFGVIDCSEDANGQRIWDKSLEVEGEEPIVCTSPDHIVVVIIGIVQIVLFLPFLVRYASLGGDPADMRTPDKYNQLQKIKHVVWDSWWIDASEDKSSMELEVGPLTRSTASGLFDVATVLGKIALVATAVFQTNNPMSMAVCFNIVVYFEVFITLYAKPFRDFGPNITVFVVRSATAWTTLCSLLVAFVNDPDVPWPAYVWYAGTLPVMWTSFYVGKFFWGVTTRDIEAEAAAYGVKMDLDGDGETCEGNEIEDAESKAAADQMNQLEAQAETAAEIEGVFTKLLACGNGDEDAQRGHEKIKYLIALQERCVETVEGESEADLAACKTPSRPLLCSPQTAKKSTVKSLANALKNPLYLMQVSKTDAFGNLPLHYSAQAGAYAALEMLLETSTDKEGGDVLSTNCNGRTALHIVADRGDVRCVEIMLRAMEWGESDRAAFLKRHEGKKKVKNIRIKRGIEGVQLIDLDASADVSFGDIYGGEGKGVEMKRIGNPVSGLMVNDAQTLNTNLVNNASTQGYQGSLERGEDDLGVVTRKPYSRLFKSGLIEELVHTPDKTGLTPFAMVLERMGRLEVFKNNMARKQLLSRGQNLPTVASTGPAPRSSIMGALNVVNKVRSLSHSDEEKKGDKSDMPKDAVAVWRARLQATVDLEKVKLSHLPVEDEFMDINSTAGYYYKPSPTSRKFRYGEVGGEDSVFEIINASGNKMSPATKAGFKGENKQSLTISPNFHIISSQARVVEYQKSFSQCHSNNPANHNSVAATGLREIENKLKSYNAIGKMLIIHFHEEEFMSNEYTAYGRKLTWDFKGSPLKWHLNYDHFPNYRRYLGYSQSEYTASRRLSGVHAVEIVEGMDLPWLHSSCGRHAGKAIPPAGQHPGADWTDNDFEFSNLHAEVRSMKFLVVTLLPVYKKDEKKNSTTTTDKTYVTFLILNHRDLRGGVDSSVDVVLTDKDTVSEHGVSFSVSALPLLHSHRHKLDFGLDNSRHEPFTLGMDQKRAAEGSGKGSWNGDIRKLGDELFPMEARKKRALFASYAYAATGGKWGASTDADKMKKLTPAARGYTKQHSICVAQGSVIAEAFRSIIDRAKAQQDVHRASPPNLYNTPLVFSCHDNVIASSWTTAFRTMTNLLPSMAPGAVEGSSMMGWGTMLGSAGSPTSPRRKSPKKGRRDSAWMRGLKKTFGGGGGSMERSRSSGDGGSTDAPSIPRRTMFTRAECNWVRIVCRMFIRTNVNLTLLAEINAYGDSFDAVWKGDVERVLRIADRQEGFAGESLGGSYTSKVEEDRHLIEVGVGFTTAHVAALAGYVGESGGDNLCNVLVERVGVDVLTKDVGGDLAVHKAVSGGYLNVVKQLLETTEASNLGKQLIATDDCGRNAVFKAWAAELRRVTRDNIRRTRRERNQVGVTDKTRFECWRFSNAGYKANMLHGNVTNEARVDECDVEGVATYLWDLCVDKNMCPTAVSVVADDCTVYSVKAMVMVCLGRYDEAIKLMTVCEGGREVVSKFVEYCIKERADSCGDVVVRVMQAKDELLGRDVCREILWEGVKLCGRRGVADGLYAIWKYHWSTKGDDYEVGVCGSNENIDYYGSRLLEDLGTGGEWGEIIDTLVTSGCDGGDGSDWELAGSVVAVLGKIFNEIDSTVVSNLKYGGPLEDATNKVGFNLVLSRILSAYLKTIYAHRQASVTPAEKRRQFDTSSAAASLALSASESGFADELMKMFDMGSDVPGDGHIIQHVTAMVAFQAGGSGPWSVYVLSYVLDKFSKWGHDILDKACFRGWPAREVNPNGFDLMTLLAGVLYEGDSQKGSLRWEDGVNTADDGPDRLGAEGRRCLVYTTGRTDNPNPDLGVGNWGIAGVVNLIIKYCPGWISVEALSYVLETVGDEALATRMYVANTGAGRSVNFGFRSACLSVAARFGCRDLVAVVCNDIEKHRGTLRIDDLEVMEGGAINYGTVDGILSDHMGALSHATFPTDALGDVRALSIPVSNDDVARAIQMAACLAVGNEQCGVGMMLYKRLAGVAAFQSGGFRNGGVAKGLQKWVVVDCVRRVRETGYRKRVFEKPSADPKQFWPWPRALGVWKVKTVGTANRGADGTDLKGFGRVITSMVRRWSRRVGVDELHEDHPEFKGREWETIERRNDGLEMEGGRGVAWGHLWPKKLVDSVKARGWEEPNGDKRFDYATCPTVLELVGRAVEMGEETIAAMLVKEGAFDGRVLAQVLEQGLREVADRAKSPLPGIASLRKEEPSKKEPNYLKIGEAAATEKRALKNVLRMSKVFDAIMNSKDAVRLSEAVNSKVWVPDAAGNMTCFVDMHNETVAVEGRAAMHMTCLARACRNGLKSAVADLIKCGAGVNGSTAGGGDVEISCLSPIAWACIRGDKDVVKLLLDAGADCYVYEADGGDPKACQSGSDSRRMYVWERQNDVQYADELLLTTLALNVCKLTRRDAFFATDMQATMENDFKALEEMEEKVTTSEHGRHAYTPFKNTRRKMRLAADGNLASSLPTPPQQQQQLRAMPPPAPGSERKRALSDSERTDKETNFSLEYGEQPVADRVVRSGFTRFMYCCIVPGNSDAEQGGQGGLRATPYPGDLVVFGEGGEPPQCEFEACAQLVFRKEASFQNEFNRGGDHWALPKLTFFGSWVKLGCSLNAFAIITEICSFFVNSKTSIDVSVLTGICGDFVSEAFEKSIAYQGKRKTIVQASEAAIDPFGNVVKRETVQAIQYFAEKEYEVAVGLVSVGANVADSVLNDAIMDNSVGTSMALAGCYVNELFALKRLRSWVGHLSDYLVQYRMALDGAGTVGWFVKELATETKYFVLAERREALSTCIELGLNKIGFALATELEEGDGLRMGRAYWLDRKDDSLKLAKDCQKNTCLKNVFQRCAKVGNFELLKELFVEGVDLDAVESSDKITPLAYACMRGDVEMSKWLVSKGGDVNKTFSIYGVDGVFSPLACSTAMGGGAKFVMTQSVEYSLMATAKSRDKMTHSRNFHNAPPWSPKRTGGPEYQKAWERMNKKQKGAGEMWSEQVTKCGGAVIDILRAPAIDEDHLARLIAAKGSVFSSLSLGSDSSRARCMWAMLQYEPYMNGPKTDFGGDFDKSMTMWKNWSGYNEKDFRAAKYDVEPTAQEKSEAFVSLKLQKVIVRLEEEIDVIDRDSLGVGGDWSGGVTILGTGRGRRLRNRLNELLDGCKSVLENTYLGMGVEGYKGKEAEELSKRGFDNKYWILSAFEEERMGPKTGDKAEDAKRRKAAIDKKKGFARTTMLNEASKDGYRTLTRYAKFVEDTISDLYYGGYGIKSPLLYEVLEGGQSDRTWIWDVDWGGSSGSSGMDFGSQFRPERNYDALGDWIVGTSGGGVGSLDEAMKAVVMTNLAKRKRFDLVDKLCAAAGATKSSDMIECEALALAAREGEGMEGTVTGLLKLFKCDEAALLAALESKNRCHDIIALMSATMAMEKKGTAKVLLKAASCATSGDSFLISSGCVNFDNVSEEDKENLLVEAAKGGSVAVFEQMLRDANYHPKAIADAGLADKMGAMFNKEKGVEAEEARTSKKAMWDHFKWAPEAVTKAMTEASRRGHGDFCTQLFLKAVLDPGVDTPSPLFTNRFEGPKMVADIAAGGCTDCLRTVLAAADAVFGEGKGVERYVDMYTEAVIGEGPSRLAKGNHLPAKYGGIVGNTALVAAMANDKVDTALVLFRDLGAAKVTMAEYKATFEPTWGMTKAEKEARAQEGEDDEDAEDVERLPNFSKRDGPICVMSLEDTQEGVANPNVGEYAYWHGEGEDKWRWKFEQFLPDDQGTARICLRTEDVCKNYEPGERCSVKRKFLNTYDRKSIAFMFVATAKEVKEVFQRHCMKTQGAATESVLLCADGWLHDSGEGEGKGTDEYPVLPEYWGDDMVVQIKKWDIKRLPLWCIASGGLTHADRLCMYAKLAQTDLRSVALNEDESHGDYVTKLSGEVDAVLKQGRIILELERELSVEYNSIGTIRGMEAYDHPSQGEHNKWKNTELQRSHFMSCVSNLCKRPTNLSVLLLKQLLDFAVQSKEEAKKRGALVKVVKMYTQYGWIEVEAVEGGNFGCHMEWLLRGVLVNQQPACQPRVGWAGNFFHYLATLPAERSAVARSLAESVVKLIGGRERVYPLLNSHVCHGLKPPTNNVGGAYSGDVRDLKQRSQNRDHEREVTWGEGRDTIRNEISETPLEAAVAVANLDMAVWFMTNGCEIKNCVYLFGRGHFYRQHSDEKERKRMLLGLMEIWKKKQGLHLADEGGLEATDYYAEFEKAGSAQFKGNDDENYSDDEEEEGEQKDPNIEEKFTGEPETLVSMMRPKLAVKLAVLLAAEVKKGNKSSSLSGWTELFVDGFYAAAKDGYKRLEFREMKVETKSGGVMDYMKTVRETFDDLDNDHSGGLDAEELQKGLGVLNEGGTPPSLTECQAMIDKYDDDGDGTIDFQEFKVLAIDSFRDTESGAGGGLGGLLGFSKSKKKKGEEKEKRERAESEAAKGMKKVFDKVDTDKSGFIDSGELFEALGKVEGVEYTMADCKVLVGIFRSGGEEEGLGFKDFVQLISLESKEGESRAKFDGLVGKKKKGGERGEEAGSGSRAVLKIKEIVKAELAVYGDVLGGLGLRPAKHEKAFAFEAKKYEGLLGEKEKFGWGVDNKVTKDNFEKCWVKRKTCKAKYGMLGGEMATEGNKDVVDKKMLVRGCRILNPVLTEEELKEWKRKEAEDEKTGRAELAEMVKKEQEEDFKEEVKLQAEAKRLFERNKEEVRKCAWSGEVKAYDDDSKYFNKHEESYVRLGVMPDEKGMEVDVWVKNKYSGLWLSKEKKEGAIMWKEECESTKKNPSFYRAVDEKAVTKRAEKEEKSRAGIEEVGGAMGGASEASARERGASAEGGMGEGVEEELVEGEGGVLMTKDEMEEAEFQRKKAKEREGVCSGLWRNKAKVMFGFASVALYVWVLLEEVEPDWQDEIGA